ncbi:PREDICTED: putative fatty acyl-CoA reductase CG5065 [Drosophila arizonae]|uniref:Fatty acyl-CoA reductase n=1 Tax=Drosophila arizonae TaxID=7263 RepID=A0ABM1NMK9_DROAR|nr:PREDICTED: putative fatty acyl-CoA reductase CG5065 [Drosophila arizonae]
MDEAKLMNLRNGFTKSLDDHCQLITGTKDESPMQMFYKDKGVFLTGGTGFFGKIIIEKLLRVTEVAQIYLLIRTKKGKDAHARIEDLFNDPVFAKMKQANPKYRCQITIISGDCSLPGLGISPNEREIIKENVNIVLHSAATVRFDEKLKMAIAINVHGTKELIKLAKEIVHLKALVHVSTAFAHCNMRYIQEKFYSGPMTGDNACKLTECLDEHTLNTLTPTLIKGYPNTYTYTKVLAENVVQQDAKKLPVTIFRPGIVITSYREPVTGWIDNMYGPCGVIVGIGSGVLRVFTGNMDNKAHIVPVDLCVNALLASAWDVARNTYETPPIYNYVPDVDNMVTWRNYMETGFKHVNDIPMRKSIWYPCFTIVPYMWQYHILCFLYHTLPAMFMDLIMVLMGKKPRMMKIYRKIHKFSNVLKFFSSNEFRFDNDNVRRLADKLDERDKRIFAFDMRDLDWINLFRVSLYGLRLYVVKDDPSNLPESIKRIKRMMVLHYSTLAIVYSLTAWALYGIIKFIFFKA